MVGDAERIRQILWNLVSNAVKFTPDGGRVTVSVGKADGKVVIAVKNTGMGIPPEFLPHLFERFRQVDGSPSRMSGGLGLGLAIVRHLTELHGGTVRAESEGLGRGATFIVTLPVKAFTTGLSKAPPGRAEVVQGTDEVRSKKDPLAHQRVLVVEDEDDARDLIEMLLSGAGAQVKSASSALTALDELRQGTFDILLSDIGMPQHDGYWLIAKVREQFPDLTAIALTAFTRPEDVARARSAGFDQHIGKPVEPARLLDLLYRCSKATVHGPKRLP
jgi:CheY-like chemotaxis protein